MLLLRLSALKPLTLGYCVPHFIAVVEYNYTHTLHTPHSPLNGGKLYVCLVFGCLTGHLLAQLCRNVGSPRQTVVR